MLMAAAGAQMTRAKVGVVVTDLIRRNPAVLAQTMLTLDHLTKGRAILGLGSGERLNIEPYGMPFDKPVARLSEGIDILRMLWDADGPVSYEGQVPPARERRARNVALRPDQPADLDRSARPAHARPDWAQVRRLAADQDDRRRSTANRSTRSGAAPKRPVASWAR